MSSAAEVVSSSATAQEQDIETHKHKTCAWGIKHNVQVTSLHDIMSEQLAEEIEWKQVKRISDIAEFTQEQDTVLPVTLQVTGDCDNDQAIAAALQEQFDKEHQQQAKRRDMQRNGLYKYQVHQPAEEDWGGDGKYDEEEENREAETWKCAIGQEAQQERAALPRRGAVLKDGKLITKHDEALSARINGSKLMNLPGHVHTGDAAAAEVRLTGRVLGALREHARHTAKTEHRKLDRKDAAHTAIMGLDEHTRLILYRMVNSELLKDVAGVLATGKEAVVLAATGDRGREDEPPPPEYCAVKVFKTTLDEFKTRDKYIKDDYRFKNRFRRPNSHKKVTMWAEKEMYNLKRLADAGIPCPRVVRLKKHVLVMEMIGKQGVPAPQLKEARLSSEQMKNAWIQVKEAMITMYTKARLIHADLSEYNILWSSGRCWFIDVSQAVTPEHPSALQFLFRDCLNVHRFFGRQGVEDLQSAEELFKEITGLDATELDIYERVRASGHSENPYPFDFAWDETKTDDKHDPDEEDSESSEEEG